MSAQYSVNIKSQYYDPNTHVNNKMSEFRLDKDQVYLPNLRLQLGFSVDTATTAHRLLGFESCIKNIRLLDGAVELDSLRFANRYLSFHNQLGQNQQKLCVSSPLSGSSIGYILTGNDKVEPIVPEHAVPTADSEVDCAIVDLRRVFPLLNSLDMLDTSVFKQLKIQIEYESDSAKLGLTDKGKVATISRPLLIADMVTNPEVSAKMRSSSQKSVIWDVIEHDQMTIDANTAADALATTTSNTQSVTSVINGFDNKFVGRMVVMKCYNDPNIGYNANNIDGYGAYNSPLYPGESLNIRKNGQFIFPGVNGIKSNGVRQHMLFQAWGDMCLLPYSGSPGIGRDDFDAASVNTSGVPGFSASAKQSDLIGQASYYGFSVEDRCNQLNFTFSRQGFKDTQANNPYNVAADIHIFGECRKQLTMSGGQYNISYM